MKKPLNIGLVGYGFMGRTHSNAFRQAPRFFDLPYQPVLKAVCARNEERVKKFAANWGYESTETDWRKLVERKDIDVIDIASPNDTHQEIAIAAAKAGKMVMCEKPLGRNAAEAEAMVAAVEKAGVPNTVWYNYRRVPAVTLIKQLIDEGKFGRIFHYRAKFLQDWTISHDLPQGGEGLWRLDVSVAGSGVTGDLLAHNIDTALWLNGPITEVSAMTETFIKERKHNLTGKVEPVGIDDASAGPVPLRERLARDVRGHALRARPQGALHARDQRRACVGVLGPARPAPPAVLRSPRRGPRARLAQHPRHRRRSALHEALVGARPADRLRAHVHPPVRRFRGGRGEGQEPAADVPRRAGDGPRHRRGPGVGEDAAVGEGRRGRRRLISEGNDEREITIAGVVLAGRLALAGPTDGGAATAGRGRTKAGTSRQPDSRPPDSRHRVRRGRGQGRGGGGGGPQTPLPVEDPRDSSRSSTARMKGWDGDPALLARRGRRRSSAQTTAENPLKENTFIIWRGGEPADFELKLEYRINSTNSGIQIRSAHLPAGTAQGRGAVAGNWVLKGYQADIDAENQFTGQIYEERGRGFLDACAAPGDLHPPDGRKTT